MPILHLLGCAAEAWPDSLSVFLSATVAKMMRGSPADWGSNHRATRVPWLSCLEAFQYSTCRAGGAQLIGWVGGVSDVVLVSCC